MSHFSSADLTVIWTVVSTRLIAFALAAGAAGYSDAQIRALGRWKSNTFKVYRGRKFLTLIN